MQVPTAGDLFINPGVNPDQQIAGVLSNALSGTLPDYLQAHTILPEEVANSDPPPPAEVEPPDESDDRGPFRYKTEVITVSVGAGLFGIALPLKALVPRACIPRDGCPLYMYIMLLGGALVAYSGGFVLVRLVVLLLELRLVQQVRVL